MKIFRNIRQKLAAENKVMAYLRYAIGEILLVVIGILIALQVNNWNDNKKTVKEEQKALINLKTDFEYNRDLLKNLIQQSDKIINANLDLLHLTGNRYKTAKNYAIDSLINLLATSPDFVPQNGSLDDLLNSGKLTILSNDKLRQLLSSWNPTLGNLKIDESTINDLYIKIEDFVNKKGSWVNIDHKFEKNPSIPKSGFTTNNTDLLQFREFENLMDNHIYFIKKIKSRQQKILEIAKKILEQINYNLKN